VRAPTEEEAERAVAFLGAFPLGAPKFHDEDINSTWRVRRTDPQKPQRGAPREKKRHPRIPEQQQWYLEDKPGHVTHKGSKEGAANSIYYVLFKEGEEFVALPVDSTVKFKPHFEVENALTLEEAETLMANRHKAGSTITQKLKLKSSETAAGGEADAAGKSVRSGLDSDEEEDMAAGPSRVKRERADDDDDAPERAESPDQGEDFDFDEVFDNDDDAMVPEDEEEEEPEEQKPKAIKAEEEEEEDLGKTGANMKKILKKHRAEGYDDSDDSEDSEDEDAADVKPEVKVEEDDDDSDMEDLDAMASHMAARQAVERQPRPGRPATPPVRPRPVDSDDEDVPLAKKMKAEAAPAGKRTPPPASVKVEGSASGSRPKAAPPAQSSKAAAPAKTSEAAKLEITKEAVIAVLKTSGKILSGELINKFKMTHKLKDKADQKKFYDIVKAVAKLEEDPPGSKRRFVVLRKQYQ